MNAASDRLARSTPANARLNKQQNALANSHSVVPSSCGRGQRLENAGECDPKLPLVRKKVKKKLYSRRRLGQKLGPSARFS